MLPARRQPLLTGLLFWYVGRLLRQHFHDVRLWAPEALLERAEAYPIVFYSNHHTWWDGFWEIPLIQRYRLDYAVMMEEKNLRKLWYFQYCGVFGVDLDSQAGRTASLQYAIKWLRAEGALRRALFLYPHGRLTSEFEPWPDFQPGLEAIVRLGRAAALPVAKQVQWGAHPRPIVNLYLAEPIPHIGRPTNEELSRALRHTLDELRAGLASGDLPPPTWSLRGGPAKVKAEA